MTFGRIAFSPSSYNPRIPAPQRVAGLGDNTTLMEGQQIPGHKPPPKPHSPVQCNHTLTRAHPRSHALTRTHAHTGSRDRTRPGFPGPGAAEPRWHLLLGFSLKDVAHPPLWGPAMPLAGWQAIWWRFLKAHLCCSQQRVGSPEEIVTLKSEFPLFVISLSPRKKV